MEIGNTDEKSGRPLIEGRGTPIDGGVFRRLGHPGIVVDTPKMVDIPWFQGLKGNILSIKSNLLAYVGAMGQEHMPINNDRYEKLLLDPMRGDRYSLKAFISQKNEEGQEIGGGSPDTQALFVASLLEMRVKDDPDRKVWIDKDNIDGHAIVVYEGKHGGTYKFDPTKGNIGFEKQPSSNVELPE